MTNDEFQMKWAIAIVVLLVAGLVFHLNLLVYAMYVLGGVLLLGWFLARTWTENLVARRAAADPVGEIGDSIRDQGGTGESRPTVGPVDAGGGFHSQRRRCRSCGRVCRWKDHGWR